MPRSRSMSGAQPPAWLRVVPPAERQRILRHVHSEAHLGFNRMYRALARRYFWKGMHRDCWRHVYGCQTCAKAKRTRRQLDGHTQRVVAQLPSQRVHIDLWGPVSKTADGNSFILSVVDAFTHFCAFIPIPDKEAHKDCWNQVLQEEIDGSLPSLEELEAFRVDSLVA